jgi:hypothetical protein
MLIIALFDGRMPIIIDQPEDSLDIRTVWLLVDEGLAERSRRGYIRFFAEKCERKLTTEPGTAEAVDPQGVLIEARGGALETELAPQDKEWKPRIPREATIPPLAGPERTPSACGSPTR